MKLYFFQCQESYGNNIYLPYSSGILWTYISQFVDINQHFELGDIFFEKKPISKYLNQVTDNSILLFSNYGWNTSYHLELARSLKEHYPNCIIIVGGPNSQQDKNYVIENDYVDYFVWGEGEQTLLELLRCIRDSGDFKSVDGISFNDNGYYKTNTRTRKVDLSEIPSPYLEGVFDNFFDRYSYNFMPIWETNRGCPYSCSFCDLGNEYYSKLYEFPTDRLLKEIDWFSEKKIEYVETADANFGILPRDLDLAKYIKKKNVETGYPQKLSATWAKSNPERVFEASKILESINRGGVTLALQSQNPIALKNIHRINIANTKLETISKKYIENGIQTYHDFILGLPGETKESWINGLLYVIDINPEGWIFGHPLEAYKNTEFSDDSFVQKHALSFAETPQVSFFAMRDKEIPLEYGKYVIETNTMSKNDYIESFLFKWFLITVHSFGWANLSAKLVSNLKQIKLSEFYLRYYQWTIDNKTLLNEEYNTTKGFITDTIEHGNFWGRQMFGDNDLYWEYEPATSIVIEQNRNRYFDELETFIFEVYGIEGIAERNNNNCLSFNDINNISFEKFCQEIYWLGRRIRKWRKHES